MHPSSLIGFASLAVDCDRPHKRTLTTGGFSHWSLSASTATLAPAVTIPPTGTCPAPSTCAPIMTRPSPSFTYATLASRAIAIVWLQGVGLPTVISRVTSYRLHFPLYRLGVRFCISFVSAAYRLPWPFKVSLFLAEILSP
jgi:hypothetical protein